MDSIILKKKQYYYIIAPFSSGLPSSLPAVSTALYSPSLKNGDSQTPQKIIRRTPKKISGPGLDLQYIRQQGRFLEGIAPSALHGSSEKGTLQFLSTVKRQVEAYAAVGHDAYPCRGIKELPGQGGLLVCGFAPILQVPHAPNTSRGCTERWRIFKGSEKYLRVAIL